MPLRSCQLSSSACIVLPCFPVGSKHGVALTIEEAVFTEDRPRQEETSDYEEDDSFDCPVCEDTHTVKFEEDELLKDHPTDISSLYVECPEASNNKLTMEYQARTPS